MVGYTDNTNIIAFGKTARDTCGQLQCAWEICREWAEARGIWFAPDKSKLIYLTRSYTAPREGI